jgi:hypothetical protein
MSNSLRTQWYHSAVILLHSRFISLKPDPNPTTGASQTGLYGECHLLCANAAESIVALVQVLERNKLLEQISSDVIHMLSQAALVSVRHVSKSSHWFTPSRIFDSFMVRP